MKGKYGIAASYDSLMRDFYALVQEESEKVPQFATKIEIKLASVKWRLPNRFLGNAEFTVLRDRLFFGLKKQIRDSIRFRFSDPIISYSELLKACQGSRGGRRGALILGQRGNLVLQIELKPKFLQQLWWIQIK